MVYNYDVDEIIQKDYLLEKVVVNIKQKEELVIKDPVNLNFKEGWVLDDEIEKVVLKEHLD